MSAKRTQTAIAALAVTCIAAAGMIRGIVKPVRNETCPQYELLTDATRLGLPTSQVSIWRMTTNQATDLSEHQRLVARLSQTSDYGWSGTGLWLRMIDASGNASWYRLWEPSAGGHLPTYSGGSPNDRFVDEMRTPQGAEPRFFIMMLLLAVHVRMYSTENVCAVFVRMFHARLMDLWLRMVRNRTVFGFASRYALPR